MHMVRATNKARVSNLWVEIWGGSGMKNGGGGSGMEDGGGARRRGMRGYLELTVTLH